MSPKEQITAELTSWDGVEAGTGRRGEFAFRLGRRELGHLHGDHAAHFFFPKEEWEELAAQGRIVEHPVLPGSHGPAARVRASSGKAIAIRPTEARQTRPPETTESSGVAIAPTVPDSMSPRRGP